MKKQLKSFGYAARGILDAFRTEAHLRFHVAAAVFVLVFAAICGFSAERVAILSVLIGTVLALELVNTSIEHACNAVTREYSARIKLAKDLAAGAVLVMAIAAIAVAALFFCNAEAICRIYGFFADCPVAWLPMGALAAASALFVALGGGKKKE